MFCALILLLRFGLVCFFVHSVTYVTMYMSITDYNLQHNLQYMDIHTIQYNNEKYKI